MLNHEIPSIHPPVCEEARWAVRIQIGPGKFLNVAGIPFLDVQSSFCEKVMLS
jgi:hypothetical protein